MGLGSLPKTQQALPKKPFGLAIGLASKHEITAKNHSSAVRKTETVFVSGRV